MALFLVESNFSGKANTKEAFEKEIINIQETLKGQNILLIEVQVSKDFGRTFFIFESETQDKLNEALRQVEIPVSLTKAVKLVGTDLDDVKNEANKVNYLVEWNLPENLTMDKYLTRKKENSVHYAEVPEVEFSRTYVCEDLTKCLCFYDAPNEEVLKKAREAVKAPIDSITEILSEEK